MDNLSVFENDIKECLRTIGAGGVILYPTDTIWGLGCDATNEAAVSKVFDIKQRPAEKSVIILLAEAKDILQYVATPPPDIIAILSSFERPTTVIYENAIGLADNVIHESGTVAIRVVKDPFCKALIKRMKKPLVSTSANISGTASPNTFADVSSDIIENVGYTVAYRQDDTSISSPSQIVRLDDEGNITYIRK